MKYISPILLFFIWAHYVAVAATSNKIDGCWRLGFVFLITVAALFVLTFFIDVLDYEQDKLNSEEDK